MGRKKVEPSEKIDVRLRMDVEFHGRIQKAADQEGNSLAAYIRAAVAEKLQRQEREASR